MFMDFTAYFLESPALDVVDNDTMHTLESQIEQAVLNGSLLASTQENIKKLLGSSLAEAVISELVEKEAWDELNDRFYKTMTFGTGGMRGRTIGRVITSVEQGSGEKCPEHPCIGTASMNYYNVGKAIQGMIVYLKRKVSGTPSIAIAHDSRHFSKDFAEYCGKVCAELGCDAYLFDGPRSTPQLSYSVRALNADAGVVLTASHNPPHDNGFKAYFADGAQIVEPDASGIISEFNSLESESYEALPENEQGKVTILGDIEDRQYMDRLKSVLLRPELLEGRSAKVVYTNLHGTGGHIVVPLLKELGFEVVTVAEQDDQNGAFPTVASPNPENAAALELGVQLAEKIQADAVIGTDPDCDRMGVVVRNGSGEMQLLTGNQIGSLMAWYRVKTMFEQGKLNDSNRGRACFVKTLVTTELQQAIADQYGIGMVNTLTGFKYIGEKLRKYENAIPADKKGDYRSLSEDETRILRLEYSKFFVFGGEESYGYLGADFVRDKDGNGSTVMFAELVAYAMEQGCTVPDLLDQVYREFGVYLEQGQSLVMEGADGAAKIAALVASYAENPPEIVDGSKALSTKDYNDSDYYDEEGDLIPRAAMLMVDLEDGRRFAVRPSGTEPKIKYYLFGKNSPQENVEQSKAQVKQSLESLWLYLENDAKVRMGE